MGANAFAVGFVCEDERTYTSCVSEYYLSDCGDDESAWEDYILLEANLSEGNSCIACPEGYDCEGGMKCPYNLDSAVKVMLTMELNYVPMGCMSMKKECLCAKAVRLLLM